MITIEELENELSGAHDLLGDVQFMMDSTEEGTVTHKALNSRREEIFRDIGYYTVQLIHLKK
jgi:hypothetical protein